MRLTSPHGWRERTNILRLDSQILVNLNQGIIIVIIIINVLIVLTKGAILGNFDLLRVFFIVFI